MNDVKHTVLYEQSMDPGFLDEVYNIYGGEKIKNCIQCGTCSGSCPVSWAMEETPRQIFAMIRAGMRDRILDSLTIWTCASCYQCAHRCPQEIKITDIMYMLKRMAIRENRQRSRQAGALSRAFVDIVNKYGRNRETELMVGTCWPQTPWARFHRRRSASISAPTAGCRWAAHGCVT